MQSGTMKIENKQGSWYRCRTFAMGENELGMMLHFQACEPWREIEKRQTGTRPNRQEKADDTENEDKN